MYAVIKTGGKQYRVQPGDVLVVEKLDGEAGAEIAFDQVLALGDGGEMELGVPMIEGGLVKATLIETRKGEKVKIFKKIRRQGYRRTKGHRQQESVLRVTSIAGAGMSADWDGEVDLTPLSVLNARARGLKFGAEVESPAAAPVVEAAPAPAAKKAPKAAAAAAPAAEDAADPALEAAPAVETSEAAPAPKARAKKAKADDAAPEGALVEQPISEIAAGEPETVAAPEAEAADAAPKKPRAKKAKPAETSEDGGEG